MGLGLGGHANAHRSLGRQPDPERRGSQAGKAFRSLFAAPGEGQPTHLTPSQTYTRPLLIAVQGVLNTSTISQLLLHTYLGGGRGNHLLTCTLLLGCPCLCSGWIHLASVTLGPSWLGRQVQTQTRGATPGTPAPQGFISPGSTNTSTAQCGPGIFQSFGRAKSPCRGLIACAPVNHAPLPRSITWTLAGSHTLAVLCPLSVDGHTSSPWGFWVCVTC
jgi:hypothetical protein